MKFGFGRSHLFVAFPLFDLKIYLPGNGRNHFNPLGIIGHIK